MTQHELKIVGRAINGYGYQLLNGFCYGSQDRVADDDFVRALNYLMIAQDKNRAELRALQEPGPHDGFMTRDELIRRIHSRLHRSKNATHQYRVRLQEWNRQDIKRLLDARAY